MMCAVKVIRIVFLTLMFFEAEPLFTLSCSMESFRRIFMILADLQFSSNNHKGGKCRLGNQNPFGRLLVHILVRSFAFKMFS